MKVISGAEGINADTLEGKKASDFVQTGDIVETTWENIEGKPTHFQGKWSMVDDKPSNLMQTTGAGMSGILKLSNYYLNVFDLITADASPAIKIKCGGLQGGSTITTIEMVGYTGNNHSKPFFIVFQFYLNSGRNISHRHGFSCTDFKPIIELGKEADNEVYIVLKGFGPYTSLNMRVSSPTEIRYKWTSTLDVFSAQATTVSPIVYF